MPKNSKHVICDVVLSAWSAVYGNLDEQTLIDAAFNDVDLVPRFKHTSIDSYPYIPQQERKLLAPHLLSATLAVEKAWSKAKLSEHRNTLRGKGKRIRHPRTAIVAGSSLGRMAPITTEINNQTKRLSPYTLSRLRGNAIAAPIAIRFGIGGGSLSLSAASATGGQAIWTAANLIRFGSADKVIVVCTDSLDSDFTKQALTAIGSVAPSAHSRPLTSKRCGMRPIEASAAIILESVESSEKRGFSPLVQWLGGTTKTECFHLIAPEPLGLALKEATTETLTSLQYSPKCIDWLSMHATGTTLWDNIESRLANEIFHPTLPHISAFKRTFGHTLGAAGLFDASIIAEGLFSQQLPRWPNNIDPELKLAQTTEQSSSIKAAMSWSAGMGGDVTVNVFATL